MVQGPIQRKKDQDKKKKDQEEGNKGQGQYEPPTDLFEEGHCPVLDLKVPSLDVKVLNVDEVTLWIRSKV